MVLIAAYNALARYLPRLAGNIGWIERRWPDFKGARLTSNRWVEAQWYLFSLLFLFGAPWALRSGAHVRVDVLYGRWSPRAKAWLDLFAMALFVLPFAVWAGLLSFDFALLSHSELEVSNDPGGLSRWQLKAAMPVAFGLLALQAVSELIKRIALLRGATPEEVGLHEPALEGPTAIAGKGTPA